MAGVLVIILGLVAFIAIIYSLTLWSKYDVERNATIELALELDKNKQELVRKQKVDDDLIKSLRNTINKLETDLGKSNSSLLATSEKLSLANIQNVVLEDKIKTKQAKSKKTKKSV